MSTRPAFHARFRLMLETSSSWNVAGSAIFAIAVNLLRLRAVPFAEATHRGTVGPAVMARVDQALRAVLDLIGPALVWA
ncbi:hypothetical protein [Streptomyces sp. NPDC058385]|uniref:hypothetical protein n=1 Tax=Streptomyces sp. NPDC058385 TaxID=3346473 RepID=UPI003647E104